MNATMELLHSHHSDRDFSEAPISDLSLDAIVEAAHRAPTSMNGQQVSLVVVRDPAKRARLAEIAGGQPWIAKAPVFIVVLMDFYKTRVGVEVAGEKQVIHESLEGYTVGAVDGGIALGTLMTAARSLGLGVVPIGGFRRDPQAVIDLLDLPPLTFPLAGVAIGHVNTPATQKPRLPTSSFRHDESYQAQALAPAILAYDRNLLDYWREIGRNDGLSWSKNTAAAYKQVYFPQTYPVAKKQGFSNDK